MPRGGRGGERYAGRTGRCEPLRSCRWAARSGSCGRGTSGRRGRGGREGYLKDWEV